MISCLCDEHHVDPSRFGDLTYPQILCVLTHGKAGEDADAGARARRVLQDFRSGAMPWDD